jgi:hypothetical protein
MRYMMGRTDCHKWIEASVSVRESRSVMISGHEPTLPSFVRRSSRAFFNTRAKNLQNTWPRIVSSAL